MEAKTKIPAKTVSIVCGNLPFFSLFTEKNYLEIYFDTKSEWYKFTVQGLFQLMDEDFIQTVFVSLERKTHKLSLLGELKTFLLHPTDAHTMCSICSKFFSVLEWIIFAPPGTILQTQLLFACSSNSYFKIHVLLGFSSYGMLKRKTDCLASPRSVIVKKYHTFLLSVIILLKKASLLEQEKRSTSAKNVQLTFSSVLQTYDFVMKNEINLTEVKKQKGYIETLNLNYESYELYKLHTTDSKFLTIQIKQISNIHHMINLCGIVGM